MKRLLRPLSAAAMVLAAAATVGAGGQSTGVPEEFSTFAVNMGALTSGGGATAQLIITVNRWSTDAEKEALLGTLKEKGQQALLDALSRAKRVGSLRTPQSVGYDLRLALDEPGEDGGRRILLFTDRPIGFYESRDRPPSVDYPFTVIDMRLNADGTGKGTMSIAAKIIPAGKNLVIENFDTQPVQLNQIKSRKLKD